MEKGQWTRKAASYLFSLSLDIARKHIMSLYNGDFHKVLLKLTDSPHREVQYNCAGIIGHLAMNGKSSLTSYTYKYMLYILLLQKWIYTMLENTTCFEIILKIFDHQNLKILTCLICVMQMFILVLIFFLFYARGVSFCTA